MQDVKNVTWVDEDDNYLGEISIDKAHQEGLLHRISATFLLNDRGEILVQHRTDGRLDHSCGGHVDPGESYLQAAERELAEELGIDSLDLSEYSQTKATDTGIRPNQVRYHLFHIFIGHLNLPPNRFTLDHEEVQAVFWQDPRKILADMKLNRNNLKYTQGFQATILEVLKYLKEKVY